MWVDITKRLIHSDEPAVLLHQVQDALTNGEDLVNNPFVAGDEFCQWVTGHVTQHEYKLAMGLNPSHFESEIERLGGLGFDLAFEPVIWQGMICQWVARPNTYGLRIESFAKRTAGNVVVDMSGLRLVEGVQVLYGFSSFNLLTGGAK